MERFFMEGILGYVLIAARLPAAGTRPKAAT
jgi:hypothetical protein